MKTSSKLVEDTELEYLVHFAAPFTESDKCIVPKGTAFAPHSPMRGAALYMHFVDGDRDALFASKVLYRESDLEELLKRCYHPAYRKD